ncbi:iron ABC transporter permease [Myxococcota bacterium]|nr:iron ABC transporter permease [Myxococcota bacterium]MBU1381164.1 iron ABC transporter permease [Myxococcota bacterium]MBU1496736.1 iron ABC transporter permease [Myxococcota bacterium]
MIFFQKYRIWFFTSLIAIIILFLSLVLGPGGLILTLEGPEGKLITHIRLPRILLSFIAGSSLAVCGAALQGLLRNPLVSPFTLGVASGSSLGAVLAIRLGLDIILPGGTFLFSLLTGMIVLIALMGFSLKRGQFGAVSVILGGVTIASFSSSAIMFIQYTSTYNESFRMVRWLMGNMDFVTMKQVAGLLPLTIPAVIALALMGKSLNLMALGHETALTSGLNVRRSSLIILGATGIAVAGVVSIAGPISFVGIVVPHVLRLSGVHDNRKLLPLSIIAGGTFLVFCDFIGRIILAPAQLPTGVVTSLTGGPFFIFLLWKVRVYQEN